MDTAVHPAPAAGPIPYERRRPEETTLYQLVQEHLETFLAQVELETGAGLPEFVKEEFDAHPHLLSSVLQIVHRVLSPFLIQQTGFQRTAAKTGAVTLIQRFGLAANLNVHRHCLVLDGVYRTAAGVSE